MRYIVRNGFSDVGGYLYIAGEHCRRCDVVTTGINLLYPTAARGQCAVPAPPIVEANHHFVTGINWLPATYAGSVVCLRWVFFVRLRPLLKAQQGQKIFCPYKARAPSP